MSEQILKEIGKGSYGRVFKINDNGEDIALKKTYGDLDTSILISYTREILIMSLLSHPNILTCLGFKISKDSLEIYTPWHPSNLKDFINYYNNSGILQIPNQCISSMLLDILQGIDFLHSNSIIHGDISEDNILITSDNRCLIADFGLSQLDYSEQERIIKEEDMGTKASLIKEIYKNPFSSPEVLKGDSYYNNFSDIWAFGVLIMRFFSINYFFGCYDDRGKQLQKINYYLDLSDKMKNEYITKFLQPKAIDSEGIFFNDQISYTYIEIINEIFIKDFNERPNAKELMIKIDFFESVLRSKTFIFNGCMETKNLNSSHKKPLLFDFIKKHEKWRSMSSSEYSNLVKEVIGS